MLAGPICLLDHWDRVSHLDDGHGESSQLERLCPMIGRPGVNFSSLLFSLSYLSSSIFPFFIFHSSYGTCLRR